MAKTFAYKAKDRTGQLLSGSIVAENQVAVAAYIRDKGYYVTNIKEIREQLSLTELIGKLRGVSGKDIAIFCRQFATMIDAGLSLVATLNILIEQTTNAKLKVALKDIYQKVQQGETLAGSMRSHETIFPTIMINMIEAGEFGGVLDEVLERLAVHFEKEHKMNEKVKSAMTYPAVVMGMAVLAVIFILTFVLPTFMQMFTNMKVELPLPTRILLGISGFLQNYWPVLAALMIGLILGLTQLYKKPKYRLIFDMLLLKVPVFGVLTKKIAIARFSRTLGTLLRGGVSIINALEVVKNTTGNMSMVKALTSAQASVREGLGLATPLGTSNVFTPMVIQMVAVGEETGELDRMLDKVADFYESDVDDMVSRLSSLLEPLLIAVLGVVIGAIVLAVAMPMFDVVTGMGK